MSSSSSNLNVSDIETHIFIIDLAAQFFCLSNEEKESFLQHLTDEYSCIDDEFSSLIDQIIDVLYNYHQSSHQTKYNEQQTEFHLLHLVSRLDDKEQVERFSTIIENMLMYINDFRGNEGC